MRRFSDLSLKTVAVLATIWILLALLGGALVTKTGSGDGCGANWPLCHGQLIPPSGAGLETWIEYTHRLVTGVAGLLIALFTIWTIVKYRKIKEVILVAGLSVFFLILQSLLGALAVLGLGNADTVMALHFGFSLMSFVTVLQLAIYVFQLSKVNTTLPTVKVSRGYKLATIGLFIYTYIVVYIGAYVRHTGSSLGCEGWPLCNGQLIPELTGNTGIAFGHRIAGLILVILVTWFAWYTLKHYKHEKGLVISAIGMLLMILLQALSGAVVVITYLQTLPALSHALFICFYFGFLFYLLLYVLRKPIQLVSEEKQDRSSKKEGHLQV